MPPVRNMPESLAKDLKFSHGVEVFWGVDDSDDGGAGKWVVEGGVEDMNVSVAACGGGGG